MSNTVVPANVLKPKRIRTTLFELDSDMSLKYILTELSTLGVQTDDVIFDKDYGYMDEGDKWNLVSSRLETPEEIQARVNEWFRDYNEKMVVINATAAKKLAQRNDKDWKEFQRLSKKFQS